MFENTRRASARLAVKIGLIPFLLACASGGPGARDDEAATHIGENVQVDEGAIIARGVRIGDNATIGPGARVGKGATIGRGAHIGANVNIPEGMRVGDGSDIRLRTPEAPPIGETAWPRPKAIKSPAGTADYPGTYSVKLDIAVDSDVMAPQKVLEQVFAALDDHIEIWPTENYYYIRFSTNDGDFWGNLRLDPADRDEGRLHFAYYEFNPDPQHPDDFFSRYLHLGPLDGVQVTREDDFNYRVSRGNKKIAVTLRHTDQTPPPPEMLGPDDVWIQNTRDESGLQFRLVFNRSNRNFIWLLRDPRSIESSAQELSAELVLDTRSGFAFYRDARHANRRILVGVNRQNIKQNNYFDGPFDQLADNYITVDSPLSAFMQDAYPYSRGMIDGHGKFKHMSGSRIAITPYMAYRDTEDLMQTIAWCEESALDEALYGCLAYDAKRHY